MRNKRRLPVVLTIAGSDSGGLAGVQADLQTFASCGVHGLTAISAITAQNSRAVSSVRVLPAAALLAQLDALRADFRIAAVKIGMLGSSANVRAVATWLRRHGLGNVVLDPVLASTSGRRLLSARAICTLREELLPLATIVTPNLPEAEALLACRLTDSTRIDDAAAELRRHGARAVLLKGGHVDSRASTVRDFYADARGTLEFAHRRLPFSARGTGCTLASAIAAGLARKMPLRRAVREAESYLQECYRHAVPVGRGSARALAHERRSRFATT